MKYIILLTGWLFFVVLGVRAQDTEKPVLFTGGMYLHTGYLQTNRTAQTINGLCSGIGGQMVFHLSKHFRLGTEGYASNYSYSANPGFYKLGWGGLLAGFQTGSRRIKPMLSLTVGGGKVRDLYLVSGGVDDNLPDQAVYRVYSTMLAVPALSLHYALTRKINLAFKIDYALPVFFDEPENYAFGPRFYIGFLFNK